MPEKKGDNEMPFAGPLESAGFENEPQLSQAEGHPEKIIRKMDDVSFYDGEKLSKFEKAKIVLEHFRELTDEYGILIPADIIIAKDEKEREEAFIITDRIEGFDLGQINGADLEKADKEHLIRELERTFMGLIRYLNDKYENDELCLEDIGYTGQWVYGRNIVGTETVKHLYLVDTDPYLSPARVKINELIIDFNNLITTAEKKLNCRFEDPMRALNDLKELSEKLKNDTIIQSKK